MQYKYNLYNINYKYTTTLYYTYNLYIPLYNLYNKI